jgi:hypothetical protein
MGFGNRIKTTYVNVLDGKISIRVEKGTPGSINRINKKGKEVSELRYDEYTGHLVGFSHRNNPHGGIDFLIDLEDSGNRVQVQVPWDSRYTKTFLNCCHNLNIREPITFRPYKFPSEEDPTRMITGWTMAQGRQKIAPKFAKEQLPRFKEVVFKGKKVWDDTEHMGFLWDAAYSWALKAGLFNTLPEQTEPTGQDHDGSGNPIDDLPPEFE